MPGVKSALQRCLPGALGHRLHCLLHGKGVPFDNLYHCCTWKSASQWFVSLFSHPLVMEYSRLDVVSFWQWFRRLQEMGLVTGERPDDVRAVLDRPQGPAFAYPRKSVATSLYLDYPAFMNLPRPRAYRAFFVMRDPRDLVTSFYFSMLKSHAEHHWVLDLRRELQGLDKDAGLHRMIVVMAGEGVFRSMLSWQEAARTDRRVLLFRYEELAADHVAFIKRLFAALRLRLPDALLGQVAEELSFARLSGGRAAGVEDAGKHLRKGVAGDWVNHLRPAHVEHLEEVSGGAVARLGYAQGGDQ